MIRITKIINRWILIERTVQLGEINFWTNGVESFTNTFKRIRTSCLCGGYLKVPKIQKGAILIFPGVISRTRKAMLGKTKKIPCLLVLRGQTVKNRFESELELNQSECKLTQMHEKRDHSLTALTDLC